MNNISSPKFSMFTIDSRGMANTSCSACLIKENSRINAKAPPRIPPGIPREMGKYLRPIAVPDQTKNNTTRKRNRPGRSLYKEYLNTEIHTDILNIITHMFAIVDFLVFGDMELSSVRAKGQIDDEPRS